MCMMMIKFFCLAFFYLLTLIITWTELIQDEDHRDDDHAEQELVEGKEQLAYVTLCIKLCVFYTGYLSFLSCTVVIITYTSVH